jgi:hypothetical protein
MKTDYDAIAQQISELIMTLEKIGFKREVNYLGQVEAQVRQLAKEKSNA